MSDNQNNLLTIIIVTYNSAAVIGNLLSSFQNNSSDNILSNVKIILVDNASSDNTVEIAEGFSNVVSFPNIEIIRNCNSGYGRAANLALRQIKTAYALLLNPDVVISFDAIVSMIETMQNNAEIGVLGAVLRDGKEENKHLSVGKSSLIYVKSIVGALMLFRMETLSKSGLFDENIFLFYEENDLCLRVKRSGFEVAILTSAFAEHIPGNSSANSDKLSIDKLLQIKSWHSGWSRGYYYRKNYNMLFYLRKIFGKIMVNLYRVFVFLLSGNHKKLRQNFYEISGIIAYMRGESAFFGNVGRFTASQTI